jgi:thiol:disulfide interchange protein
MEKIKQYWKELVIALSLIALLTVSTCSHNSQMKAEGEKIQLKKELKEIKVKIAEAEKTTKVLFDSLSAEDAKKDKRIADLNKSNKQLSDNQIAREKELKKEKEKISNYSYTQSAQVLNERYKTDAVKATATSVNLEKDIPNKVIAELVEKDVCEENSADKDTTIKNKDGQIKLEQEKTLSANIKTASVQVEKELLKDGLQTAEEINKKSEKQIKSLKTKNFISKVLVVAAFIGGIFIAK